MSNGFVFLGDKNSHGGKVIYASSNITVDEKKAALVGHLVSGPVPGHSTNPIVEGSPNRTFNGHAVVADGCKCQCVCTVISSAMNGTVG